MLKYLVGPIITVPYNTIIKHIMDEFHVSNKMYYIRFVIIFGNHPLNRIVLIVIGKITGTFSPNLIFGICITFKSPLFIEIEVNMFCLSKSNNSQLKCVTNWWSNLLSQNGVPTIKWYIWMIHMFPFVHLVKNDIDEHAHCKNCIGTILWFLIYIQICTSIQLY